jgi:hypothetical protein
MADLTLHPEAQKSFDLRAAALVPKLATIRAVPPQGLQTDVHVTATLSTDDVDNLVFLALDDSTGRPIPRSFPTKDGGEVGLLGTDFGEFGRLVEDFQRTKSIRPYLSKRFVADRVFAWIREAYAGVAGSMSERVVQDANSAIRRFAVWVPISDLVVEADWPFGRVLIRPLGRDVFDRIAIKMAGSAQSSEVKGAVERRVNRYRSKFQGRAAAVVVDIEAEPSHAIDTALALAQETADMVRIFHPSQFTPRARCHLDVAGQAPERTTTAFLFQGEELAQTDEATTNPSTFALGLSQASLMALEFQNLAKLSDLLRIDDRTAFLALGLDTLRRYSRGVLATTEEDRLLYVLVAIESVLLRNDNEPIQQAIADRLAFFLETEASERQKTTHVVRAAYAARSGYVHHGRSIKEEEDLAIFFNVAWTFFIRLIPMLQRFQTRDEFIKSIEDVKYA